MLSRTADHVYWLGRYVERAENLARALDVQHRLSLLPQPTQLLASGWLDTLDELGALPAYRARHGEVTPAQAIEFLCYDRDSPASVFGCLRSARENARAVRGAITSEMWETLNTTWLDMQSGGRGRLRPAEFIDWVKHRSQLLYGVMLGTLLRDEAYCFLRMGAALERADGTARILGARLATGSGSLAIGGYYQWSVLLQALSAFENYRKLFRDAVTPERVAELLILREDYPRSLRRAAAELYEQLQRLFGGSGEVRRRCGELEARLRFGRIDALLAGDLRAFVDGFVKELASIDRRIAEDFMLPALGTGA